MDDDVLPRLIAKVTVAQEAFAMRPKHPRSFEERQQPELSSSPISTARDHRGLAMTALEIGVIVGTAVALILGVFFVFYCRQSERASSTNDMVLQHHQQQQEAEEGRIQEPPAVHQPAYRRTLGFARHETPRRWLLTMLQRQGERGESERKEVSMIGNLYEPSKLTMAITWCWNPDTSREALDSRVSKAQPRRPGSLL
jgi:hypothetical protein